MLQNPRGRKSFKKKLTGYILLLIILGLIIFFINLVFLSRNPLFISPMGESNIDSYKVEKILKDNNILVSRVLVLSDSSYLIIIPNNGQVRFSSQKDINSQISSLQRILRELTIEGKPFKNMDFRFDEPIISF